MFDAFELTLGRGKSIGIYNYAKHLYQAMSSSVPAGWQLSVACHGDNVADFSSPSASAHRGIVQRNAPGQLQRQLWLRSVARREALKRGAQVYFSPKGFLPGLFGPMRDVKSVVVIHDLIPLWYARNLPGYFGFLERQLVVGGLKRTAKWADAIIAISDSTAADIESCFARSSSVAVVHNGLPFTSPTGCPVPHRYIFAIASPLPHKNAAGVLAAYRAYRAGKTDPLPMIICGIDDPGEPGVSAVGRLTDIELHSYYAGASAFLFLSLIEGFGFPPLEAMSHGVPVITSNIPVMRELVGGIATLVEPSDPIAAGARLSETLAKADLEYPARARSRTSEYNWARCAAGVWDVIQTNQASDS